MFGCLSSYGREILVSTLRRNLWLEDPMMNEGFQFWRMVIGNFPENVENNGIVSLVSPSFWFSQRNTKRRQHTNWYWQHSLAQNLISQGGRKIYSFEFKSCETHITMASEDKAVPTEKMADLKIDSGGMWNDLHRQAEFGVVLRSCVAVVCRCRF